MSHIDSRYAERAARLLAEHRQAAGPVANAPQPETRRDALVAAMALAIAEKKRRRRILRASAVALATAASVALVFGLARGRTVSRHPTGAAFYVAEAHGADNQLVRGAATQSLSEISSLLANDWIRSGAKGGVTLASGNGTRITLGASSRLRADELMSTRRFSLVSGHLDARVAKLGVGERFIVDTPSVEVEVRGTHFSVAVAAPAPACADSGPVTLVKVSEGVVAVRFAAGQVLLHPGETWTAPCPAGHAATAAAPREEPGATPQASAVSPARRTVGRRSATTKSATATPSSRGVAARVSDTRTLRAEGDTLPASNLTEQNDLFQAAMDADRAGQTELALRKLADLLARYPGGPLAESARAERTRMQAGQVRLPNP
jgi:hypothetical protein